MILISKVMHTIRWTANPRFRKPHLAVAEVSDTCGASEFFDEFVNDNDDEDVVPVYFWGPYITGDALMVKLEARLDIAAYWSSPPLLLSYTIMCP